jgi:hypothetical protein
VEPVSNDSLWGRTLARRRVGAFVAAVAALPWDGAQAVLALYDHPADELRLYDRLWSRRAPGPALASAGPAAGGGPAAAGPALLCSADAHGWPSYRAAFEAFSMHVAPGEPLSGEAPADARRVVDALLDGDATCVFDGVAAADGLSLAREGRTLTFRARHGPNRRGDDVRVVHDGESRPARPVPSARPGVVEWALCEGECPPGAYRVEARLGGRPWIFTNPVRIE